MGRGPTLSAGRKILVAAKAAHYHRPQSLGDDKRQMTEGLRQRSLSDSWAISLLKCNILILLGPRSLSRNCGTSTTGFRHWCSSVRYLLLRHSCSFVLQNRLSKSVSYHPDTIPQLLKRAVRNLAVVLPTRHVTMYRSGLQVHTWPPVPM